MRIDKFISELGIASRKEAALAAKRGGVTVDGECVKDVSVHINPEKNVVCYMGRELSYERFVYVMLNKPAGYVSATDDATLPYVVELLPKELRERELFPVGRLDRDTVGLMLLTNNGKLAHRLLAPKRHVTKRYYFECDKPLDFGVEEKFSSGVTLADGYECLAAKIELNRDRTSGIISLTEGKYHQIKRMIAAVGSHITALERISFGPLSLDTALSRGEWRYLTDEEKSLIEGLN